MPVIELEINVEGIEQVSILYDRLEIFRSPDQDGDPTPFSSITALESTQARIDGTVHGPWNLNGLSMGIVVDGAPAVSVSFSGTDPFTLPSVRDIINNTFASLSSPLASEVPIDTNKVRLTSPSFGTQSVLQVTGAAAVTLGLSTDRIDGKSASPLLSVNTEIYTFNDFDGQPTYWYKSRYLNSETGAISNFSTPFLGSGGAPLPSTLLSTGKIAISDVTGSPIKGRRIIFVPTSAQVIADGGGNNYGVLPSVDRIVVVTDDNGRALVSLVKGQRVKVFIEGTTFQREFVVPTSDFDILTVASVQPDPLSIVVAPPLAIRVS